MGKLITSDSQLRSYIPQQVCAVKGEQSLYDKITNWITTAEQWVFDNIFDFELYVAVIPGTSQYNDIKNSLYALIVHKAFAEAIPSLDVVQTVNGFAVVSNQNLAPASKERVERLIASHCQMRDTALAYLVSHIGKVPDWKNFPQCEFFRESLFLPLPEQINSLGSQISSSGSLWDKFIELRPKIEAAENRLASEFISHELMQRLRDANLGISELSTIDSRLCAALRTHVADLVAERPLREQQMRDIVNYIRQNADDFEQWHRSETAKLFAPPVFKNKKKSQGYWF